MLNRILVSEKMKMKMTSKKIMYTPKNTPFLYFIEIKRQIYFFFYQDVGCDLKGGGLRCLLCFDLDGLTSWVKGCKETLAI